jgi:hypothetical protein
MEKKKKKRDEKKAEIRLVFYVGEAFFFRPF